MKFNKLNLLSLLFSLLLIFNVSADDDHDEVDEKYYHTHEGSDYAHDLRMAIIDFETDKITNIEDQLVGYWELKLFQTTDHEMDELVRTGTFKIHLDVYHDYFQTSVYVSSNGKEYQDPPIEFSIEGGDMVFKNSDFAAGLKDSILIFTMLGFDEAYRYTFEKSE